MTDIQKTLISAAKYHRKLNTDFPLHMNVHEDGILVRAMNGEDRYSRLVLWDEISQARAEVLNAALDDAVRAVE